MQGSQVAADLRTFTLAPTVELRRGLKERRVGGRGPRGGCSRSLTDDTQQELTFFLLSEAHVSLVSLSNTSRLQCSCARDTEGDGERSQFRLVFKSLV